VPPSLLSLADERIECKDWLPSSAINGQNAKQPYAPAMKGWASATVVIPAIGSRQFFHYLTLGTSSTFSYSSFYVLRIFSLANICHAYLIRPGKLLSHLR
jgi:hypothetical protein